MFPEVQLREKLRFEGNKTNLSDLLYSTKRKTCNDGNDNGGRRSTFAGNSALLPSEVIDFALLSAQRLLAGNSLLDVM